MSPRKKPIGLAKLPACREKRQRDADQDVSIVALSPQQKKIVRQSLIDAGMPLEDGGEDQAGQAPVTQEAVGPAEKGELMDATKTGDPEDPSDADPGSRKPSEEDEEEEPIPENLDIALDEIMKDFEFDPQAVNELMEHHGTEKEAEEKNISHALCESAPGNDGPLAEISVSLSAPVRDNSVPDEASQDITKKEEMESQERQIRPVRSEHTRPAELKGSVDLPVAVNLMSASLDQGAKFNVKSNDESLTIGELRAKLEVRKPSEKQVAKFQKIIEKLKLSKKEVLSLKALLFCSTETISQLFENEDLTDKKKKKDEGKVAKPVYNPFAKAS